jgi:hypothetical protein
MRRCRPVAAEQSAGGGEGETHPQRLIGPCFRWLFLSRLVMCITSVPDCKGMRAEMA